MKKEEMQDEMTAADPIAAEKEEMANAAAESVDVPPAPSEPTAEAAPAEAPPAEAPPAEPVAEALEAPAPEAPAPEGEGEALSPEDAHREAAWAGRLRKREEELKTREEALAKGRGERFEAAKARLSADFGEEYVSDLIALMEGIHGGAAGGDIRAMVDEAINSFRTEVDNTFRSQHAEYIADKGHGDVEDVVASEEFNAWRDGQDPERQAQIDAIVERGSARQVVRLMTEFKESLAPKADTVDAAAMKAAEGVRSVTPPPPVGAESASGDPVERFRKGFRTA